MNGGAKNKGTIFSIDPKTGAETVLHSFSHIGMDGVGPSAGSTNVDHKLFGTTCFGGEFNRGTVFSFDLTSGTERVLHRFNKDGQDGRCSYSDLIDVGGTLYGMTIRGGAGKCYKKSGCGTVFSVDETTGEETVVQFFDGYDGGYPYGGGMILRSGVLYGMTSFGGTYGGGVVFSIAP